MAPGDLQVDGFDLHGQFWVEVKGQYGLGESSFVAVPSQSKTKIEAGQIFPAALLADSTVL